MSNLYRNFFHSQISEHQLVIKKLKERVEEKFIKVLEIWYSAVKFSLVMGVVLLMLNIYQLN